MKNNEKTNPYIFLIIMIIITVFSMILAREGKYILFLCVGFGFMLGVSKIPTESIMKYIDWVGIVLFVLQGLSVSGIIEYSKYGLFVNGLKAFYVPILDLIIYKYCLQTKKFWYVYVWIMGSFFLIKNKYLMVLLLILFATLVLVWLEKNGLKKYKMITIAFLFLNLEGLVLFMLGFAYRTQQNWAVAFITKQGKASYIYEVLNRFLTGSKFWGRSMEYSEIVAWLPEYKTSCVFTYYIAEYGIAVGIGICIFMIAIFIKWLLNMKQFKETEQIIGIISIVSLAYYFVVNILMNLQMLPFISQSVFLPFFSQELGSIISSYILAGFLVKNYGNTTVLS